MRPFFAQVVLPDQMFHQSAGSSGAKGEEAYTVAKIEERNTSAPQKRLLVLATVNLFPKPSTRASEIEVKLQLIWCEFL
jgi:hypothetical protein